MDVDPVALKLDQRALRGAIGAATWRLGRRLHVAMLGDSGPGPNRAYLHTCTKVCDSVAAAPGSQHHTRLNQGPPKPFTKLQLPAKASRAVSYASDSESRGEITL